MNGRTCENCRFWERYSQGTARGQCRRYPPQGANGFPGTLTNQWCGEHQLANPETVDEAAVQVARLVLLGDLTAARALVDRIKELG